ncbi:hypothetical protein [Actinomyces viscosus]|uniref:hypothetical protein n=1 Tax=Actinomyces viscosus TaxID=1656 RepID=UPI0028EC3F60|nr:hypothetical protein [Actinomyces viscosus]
MSEQEWRAKGGKALTASVDLNSTETKTMAYDFMAAAGIPTPSSSGSSPRENFGKATNTFFGAVQDRGVLTVQDVERDTSTYGAEASAKHGIGVGLGVQYTDQEVKMSNGYYYDIETGEWKKWEGC